MALTVAQIDLAIAAINAGGQEYTEGDFTFRRGDLDDLRKMRLAAVAQERAAGQTIFQRVRFGKVQ